MKYSPIRDPILNQQALDAQRQIDEVQDVYERIPQPFKLEAMSDIVTALLFGVGIKRVPQEMVELSFYDRVVARIHQDELDEAFGHSRFIEDSVLTPAGFGITLPLPSDPSVFLDLRSRVRSYLMQKLELPKDAVRVFWLLGQNGPSAFIRANIPAHYLESRNIFIDLGSQFNPEIGDYDVFVFERQYHPVGVEAVKQIQAAGKIAVFETDDNCLAAPKQLMDAQHFQAQSAISMKNLAAACNYILVSTEKLGQQIVEQYSGDKPVQLAVAPNIRVVNNKIDYAIWNEMRTKHWRAHLGTRVLWAGGAAHGMLDARVFPEVVKHFVNRKAPVTFVLAGIFIEALQNRHDLAKHVEVHGIVPPSQYPAYVSALSCDIGIAMLDDNEFNLGKSDLKWLEYTAAGLPTIASNVGPYNVSIYPDITGLLVQNTVSSWCDAIQKLIDEAELRRKLVIDARDVQMTTGRDITSEFGLDQWESFFRDITGIKREGVGGDQDSSV